jgi:hypothetical protein
MMKTVFLKELRENFKWAAVIFGVIGVMVYWNVKHAGPYLLQSQLTNPITLLFGALAGLLLGFVQTLFETRPDNWAFVVHRPVSRRAIFVAKSAAGLLLLSASLGLPCLLAALWAARPGNLPMPFQTRMLTPILADVLTAGCYYFVGMILTLRKAHWFGTRVLPLGLGLACSLASFFSEELWIALTFILAAQAAGALAAWAAFSSGGSVEQRGPGSVGVGIAVYCGALFIGILLIAALGAFQTTSTWRQYRFAQSGDVLVVTKTRTSEEFSSVITDAYGHAAPGYENVDPDDPANASRFLTSDKGLLDDQLIGWPFSVDLRGYRASAPGVIPLKAVAPPNVKLRWICLFNAQRRIIELYDSTTHLLFGTVGPAGFAPSQAQPAALFPGKPFNSMAQSNTHTMAFPHEVYWLELDQRRVRRIFNAPPDDAVVSVAELPPLTDPRVVVLTHHRIHVLRPSGEALYSISNPYDTATHWFDVALLPANQHLLLWAGTMVEDTDPAFRQERSEFAPDGTLVHREIIPALPADDTPLVRRRTALFGAVYPLAGLPIFSAPVARYVLDVDPGRHPWLLRNFLFASSMLCALATLLLGKRYGFSNAKTLAWSAANLLIGPAGIIVMAGLNDRPAQEACAACGRISLAGRRDCSRCGAARPAPTLDGREIFEPVDAFQPAM